MFKNQYLLNRWSDLAEILGQVRVPEMQKNDRARFFKKTPFLVISGGNVGKNQRFKFLFTISTLVLANFFKNLLVFMLCY